MNNNIQEALWKDYNDLGEILNVIKEDDERKSNILEERDKIRNELIKFELGKNEIEVKRDEIKSENERDRKQNIINISMFGVSTLLSLYAIIRTFNFDQESTVTSTLGRNILNNVVPKLFKK